MSLLWRTAVWPYFDDDEPEPESSDPSEYHHRGWERDWKPEHHSDAPKPDGLRDAFKVQQASTARALREARIPVAPEEQKRTALPSEVHFETGHTLGIENPMKAKFRALVSRENDRQRMPGMRSEDDGLSWDPEDSVRHSYRLTLFPPSGSASWTVPNGPSKGERRTGELSWIDRFPNHNPLKHDTDDDDPSNLSDHIKRFMSHPDTRRYIRETAAPHVELD